jgi:hypothetical protein
VQHASGVIDDLVQVEDAPADHLAPREREQLGRERRRPRTGVLDLLDEAAGLRIAAHFVFEHLRVAENCRQQVVEVVRDAPRQAADALHFLSLEQLILERATLADVLHEHQRERGVVLLVTDDRRGHFAPRDQAVLVDVAFLDTGAVPGRGRS